MSDTLSEIGFPTPDSVEAAFYSAFANCDYRAMGMVWAAEDIICIHPGSPVLLGHDVVMRSWANILLNAEPPTLHVEVVSRIQAGELAVHVVYEHISAGSESDSITSVIQATNVYRRKSDGWRLAEHHASVPHDIPAHVNPEMESHPTLQ